MLLRRLLALVGLAAVLVLPAPLAAEPAPSLRDVVIRPTGRVIARSLADRLSETPSITDFGRPVNGDWTPVFQAAEASDAPRIMLPPGRYPTRLNHYQATTKTYTGPGQLVVGADSSGGGGTAEAPHRAFITAPLPDVPDDRNLSYNADWSKAVPGGAAYTFVGSGATGTPTNYYKNFPQLSQTFRTYDNGGGFNTDPSDHAKGRSGMFADNLRVYQGGQGDLIGRTTFANVYSTRAGATHFLAGPQVGIENGNLGAGGAARGAFLQKQEYIINDTPGASVSAINSVMNYHRNTDADGLYQIWGHDRVQSAGPIPLDFAYSLAGPIRRGFDTTPADFGGDQAAIILKRGHRIYFGGYADPDPLNIQFKATSLGFNYISEGDDGHLHITVGGGKTVVFDNLPTSAAGVPYHGLYIGPGGALMVAQ